MSTNSNTDKRKRDVDTSPLDRITEDGILCSIIASLPLKEAVRTCVLSHRWRHIWTYLPNLNFDAEYISPYKKPHQISVSELLLNDDIRTNKFITSVDSVLQKHQGLGVETLKIEYDFHTIHSHHLDEWIRFAIASKAINLIVRILPSYLTVLYKDPPKLEPYVFPFQLLRSSLIETLALTSCTLKLIHGFTGLPRLKILKLHKVHITDECIEYLLSNITTTLEVLALNRCQQLTILSTPRPLNQLKHLSVFGCDQLRKIEIAAVNLNMLGYLGPPVNFIFRESPKLRNGSFFPSEDVDFAITRFLDNFPHLEKLVFAMSCDSKLPVHLVSNSSRFIHLKNLVWFIPYTLWNERGILCLASLLNAAPFVEKFTLRYIKERRWKPSESDVKQKELTRPSPHTHLRTVNFLQFTGDKWQIRFIVYLLNCAVELQSMTIQKDDKYLETNMEYLEPQLPTNAKLLIL